MDSWFKSSRKEQLKKAYETRANAPSKLSLGPTNASRRKAPSGWIRQGDCHFVLAETTSRPHHSSCSKDAAKVVEECMDEIPGTARDGFVCAFMTTLLICPTISSASCLFHCWYVFAVARCYLSITLLLRRVIINSGKFLGMCHGYD